MPKKLQNFLPWICKISELLEKSHVVLPKDSVIRLYHHTGVENWNNIGAAFIEIIRHDYCKFVVIMLAGQSYPLHFHRIKDESYFVLWGDLNVEIEDEISILKRGDIINVPRRFNHKFHTNDGCVFEEISTAYLQNDSVYDDKKIKTVNRDMKITEFPLSLIFDTLNMGELLNE